MHVGALHILARLRMFSVRREKVTRHASTSPMGLKGEFPQLLHTMADTGAVAETE